jgi:hypothetical protein
MRRAIAACLATLILCLAAVAASSVHIAGATIRFDDARFKSTSIPPDGASFTPIGRANDGGAVEIASSASTESCVELARRAFAAGPYDVRNIEASAINVGGLAGTRFATHTRCRNATPRGEVACVKMAERTYLLTALQPGCHGNPFSRSDTLGEIAAGVTFASEH